MRPRIGGFSRETTKRRPELELPIKYTLPFKWGSFSVTESADLEYGLVPLTATKLRGEPIRLNDRPSYPVLNITLIGPNELSTVGAQIDDNDEVAGIWGRGQVHDNNIDLSVGLTRATEEIRQMVLDQVSLSTGMDEDEIAENMLLENDVPLPEALEQEVRQMIVHMLRDYLLVAIASQIRESSEAYVDKAFVKQTTKLGGATIAASGLLIAVDVASERPLSVVNGPILAIFIASAITSLNHSFKAYLTTKRKMATMIDGASKGAARSIVSDFHNTYCTRHFDAQESAMFGDGEDEDSESIG